MRSEFIRLNHVEFNGKIGFWRKIGMGREFRKQDNEEHVLYWIHFSEPRYKHGNSDFVHRSDYSEGNHMQDGK